VRKLKSLPCDTNLFKIMHVVGNGLLGLTEVSAQHAAYYLLGHNLVEMSRQVETVHVAPRDALPKSMRDKPQRVEDEDGNITTEIYTYGPGTNRGIRECYEARPESVEHLPFLTFLSLYLQSKGKKFIDGIDEQTGVCHLLRQFDKTLVHYSASIRTQDYLSRSL